MKNGRVGAIVGLDPARPGFNKFDSQGRLNDKDAKYVEVVHTNWKCFGFKDPIGTADFYVNGGYSQPGCPWLIGANACDHQRAVLVFAETMKKTFRGKSCKSTITDGHPGRCKDLSYEVKMGGEPTFVNKPGVFYVQTNSQSPFA